MCRLQQFFFQFHTFFSHGFCSHHFSFFSIFYFSMRCYRLWWKLAKRRDIVNFWHRHEQWTPIHARRRPNSLKLHTSAVHVSKAYSFIMHIVLLILMDTHTLTLISMLKSDFRRWSETGLRSHVNRTLWPSFPIFLSFVRILLLKTWTNIFHHRPNSNVIYFFMSKFDQFSFLYLVHFSSLIVLEHFDISYLHGMDSIFL